MTRLIPRTGSSFPELLQWLETELPFGGRHPVRIERFTEDDQYVVRCELPGLDPEKDLHLMVEGNQLEIRADRPRDGRANGHSEFQYGSFSRRITLPANSDTDQLDAKYENGILTVRAPMRVTGGSRQVPVARPGL